MHVFVDLDQNGLVERMLRQQEHPGAGFFEVVSVSLQEVVVGEIESPSSPETIPLIEEKYHPEIDPATQIAVVEAAFDSSFEWMRKCPETGFLIQCQTVTPPVYDEPTKTLTLGPYPLGTEIEVFDIGGEEQIVEVTADVEDWTDQLIFEDAGSYRIEIRPPVPYLPTTQEIDIADQA